MLDQTDRMLLSLLKKDARQKYSELGEQVHLSPPAVHERVKKLERMGVIERYTIEIDADALGLALYAFVHINISQASCEQVAKALKACPEVEECFSSAGEESMLVKVHTTTPVALETLLDHIRSLAGVERTQTSIILTKHFERTYIPMENDAVEYKPFT